MNVYLSLYKPLTGSLYKPLTGRSHFTTFNEISKTDIFLCFIRLWFASKQLIKKSRISKQLPQGYALCLFNSCSIWKGLEHFFYRFWAGGIRMQVRNNATAYMNPDLVLFVLTLLDTRNAYKMISNCCKINSFNFSYFVRLEWPNALRSFASLRCLNHPKLFQGVLYRPCKLWLYLTTVVFPSILSQIICNYSRYAALSSGIPGDTPRVSCIFSIHKRAFRWKHLPRKYK